LRRVYATFCSSPLPCCCLPKEGWNIRRSVYDSHNFNDVLFFSETIEQEVLFKLLERQDAQPTELGMVEIAQASNSGNGGEEF
jgi:hypothetical protein